MDAHPFPARLAVACLLGTASPDTAEPLPVRLASTAHRLHHLCRDLLSTYGIDTAAAGVLPDGPVVLLAAGLDPLDPLAILSETPSLPIASPGSASWPVLGPAARAATWTLGPDGEGASPTSDDVHRILSAGTSVLGLRGDLGATRQARHLFDRTLLIAARTAGLPVVPVHVRYHSAPGPRATVVFGRGIDPSAFPDARSLGRAAGAILDAGDHTARA